MSMHWVRILWFLRCCGTIRCQSDQEQGGQVPSLYNKCLLRALRNTQDLQLFLPSKGRSNNGFKCLALGHRCLDRDLNQPQLKTPDGYSYLLSHGTSTSSLPEFCNILCVTRTHNPWTLHNIQLLHAVMGSMAFCTPEGANGPQITTCNNCFNRIFQCPLEPVAVSYLALEIDQRWNDQSNVYR